MTGLPGEGRFNGARPPLIDFVTLSGRSALVITDAKVHVKGVSYESEIRSKNNSRCDHGRFTGAIRSGAGRRPAPWRPQARLQQRPRLQALS